MPRKIIDRRRADFTPLVSYILVSYNTCELLAQCIESIRTWTREVSYEVIVVDNASRDASVAMVEQRFPEVVLVASDENVGFGAANNEGFALSRGAFTVLLNSDAMLLTETVAPLIAFLRANPRVAVVTPRVLLMDGSVQPKTYGLLPSSRVIFNQSFLLSRLFPRVRAFGGVFLESTPTRETSLGWVSGVCMIIRREAYAAIKGFDPAYFLYAEDIDLCRRFVAGGWLVYRVDDYAIKHLCGASTKSDDAVIRNGVLQQRNFLMLVDSSSGPIGRLFARGALGVGLALRVGLRGIRYAVARGAARVPFQVSLQCLVDLFGGPKPSLHAPRR